MFSFKEVFKIKWKALVILFIMAWFFLEKKAATANICSATDVCSFSKQYSPDSTDQLLQEGYQQYESGNFSEAISIWQQVVELYRETQDGYGESTTLVALGAAFNQRADYEQATSYLELAGEIAEQEGYQGILNQSLAFLTLAHFKSGAHENAVSVGIRSVRVSRSLNDTVTEVSSLNLIGNAYEALHDYTQALNYYQQYFQTSQASGSRLDIAKALGNIGSLYLKSQRFDLAESYFTQSLDLSRDVGDALTEANALSGLGTLYRSLGLYQSAISYQKSALEIAEEHNFEAAKYFSENLANIFKDLGLYDRAMKYYEQSLEISTKFQDFSQAGKILGSIGAVFADRGQYEIAIDYYQKSMLELQNSGDSRSLGYVLLNLGSAYHSWGKRYDLAADYFFQTIQIAQAVSDSWLEAEALSNLGFIEAAQENYQSAIVYYDQGLDIFFTIKDRQAIAIALNNRAHTLLNWGNQSLSQGQDALGRSKLQKSRENLQTSISFLDDLRLDTESDDYRVSLFDTQVTTYNLLQQVLVADNQTESALEVSEQGRSRAFTTLLAEKQQLQTEDISLDQLKAIARSQNATLVEYSLVPDDDFVHQGKLQGTTAEIYIWVVQPDGTVHFRRSPIDTQTHRLEDLVKTSRTAIGVRSRGFVSAEPEPIESSENLKTLHQLLISPIQDLLPADPEKQVIFIPQGDLFLVPFAALMDNAGDYLIQHHTLFTAPSIEILALTQRQQAKLNPDQPLTPADLLIVGNPVMPEVWDAQSGQMKPLSPLEGAEQEAQAIATLFNTSALTGAEATEQTIKQRIGSARLVHLATHGLLEYGNPQDSGISDVPGAIALAPGQGEDGLLTSAEILETLDLKAELVVLSACDTGLGDITGDGVIGLSRALITAGTPSVIVSLWSVPDAPTAQLMTVFYQQVQQGQDKAQALRQAMLETMKTTRDPRDWAAFTLIGAAD